jgi:hypothetical protein
MTFKPLLAGALTASLFLSLPAAHGAEAVFITEFLAVNDGPLADEDGESSDWIELHNAGTNTVNLNGWFLTDKAAQLTQWRFPATNLAPNAYLLVFASGKDRRAPGAPLHTNFRLASGGEYLALVKPDGTNVVSAYAPAFPPQIAGVSYGIPTVETVTTLVASGALARVLVPADGALGAAWTGVGFDDSGWLAAPTGVGFETDGRVPFVPAALADSVADFSGTQGRSNWFYGYWDQGADPDRTYADSEFVAFPTNFWTGTAWDWFSGDPPFTRLTSTGGQPTGENGQPAWPTHWAVRRYVNPHPGALTLRGRLTHTSDWFRVTASGVAASSLLYIYLTGAGEGYIDDLALVAGAVPEAGPNLLVNGDFDSLTLSPWTVSANLAGSVVTRVVKHSGEGSLRLVATAGGSSQSSAIWQAVAGLVGGQTYTLSYWYRPVTNNPPAVVRFSGGWIQTQATGCGDGVIARIVVDGTPAFERRAHVSHEDFTVTVPARLGSRVDFALDPGPASDAVCDETTFTAAIETADPAEGVVADSVADWSTRGTQGEHNWFYGYYNKSADPDRTYQAGDFQAFPRDNGPPSASNFWDQEEWDWFSGNPPFDRIGQYWMMPNGTNSGAEHWVIRRWVSEISGPVTLEWAAFKSFRDQYHLGGGGVTLRVFQNGVQRDAALLRSNDVFGIRRTVRLASVQVGDRLDLALDPTNEDGRPHDDQDTTVVTVVIRGLQSLAGQAATDLEGLMQHANATAYLRCPFTVADPAAFNSLTLRLKYDDGFIAYLNGVEVARANTPLEPDWRSAATTSRSDAEARAYEDFNLSAWLGLLRSGDNVLALHGLNAAASDADFLLLPELLAASVSYEPSTARYFSRPTPGGPNGLGNTNLGPLILAVSHTPGIPKDDEDLLVTARVAPSFHAVRSVSLIYRVMFSNEVSIAMLDDGVHGDGAAGDGTWGASLPASASTAGQMVRYYVYATDARTNGSRFPPFEQPKNSPQYQGTVVVNPALTNPLPVLHLFVQNPALATNYAGTRCSVFWDEEFFDNIEVNAHGQTTWRVFPKRSMDFNLNTGEKLRWQRGEARVKAFDLLSAYADKAYLRLVLAFETFRDADVPTHYAFPVRVQQNNAFHSVAHFVEQANDDFLARHGLDPTGPLYKIYFPLTNAYAGVKKETRKNEPNDDLQALIDGLNQSGPALRRFLFDQVDVAEAVNFFATIEVVQNEDCCWYKNYYLHRDTAGAGEWRILPWDLDLVFGRTFTAWPSPYQGQSGGYFDTNIYWTNRWFSEQRASADFIGVGQPLFEALYAFPDTQEMFFRRWGTVQETFLGRSNTHPLLLKLDRRVDQLTSQLQADAALDLALWGTWPPSPPVIQTQPQAAGILQSQYFAPRRGWIFHTLAYANGGPYLGPQPGDAVIRFGALEVNPASGNQSQEYIQLQNPNNYPVDLSGWSLAGAIRFTFRGGTVLPSGGALYVSPDVKAFRLRTTGPRGGQGHFVVGNYRGQLSARGETLQVLDAAGRVVDATNYPGAPSLAQQYLRLTELMYHPAPPPPGLATNADEFEYVELKNIGPVDLNLVGVRFVNGIQFTFTADGPITNLPPGQSVLVVRNLAAFSSRYGAGLPVAGQYTGLLNNDGENLRLEDAAGERILDFDYRADWLPASDGLGFALVVVDESAAWNTWGQPGTWRLSSSLGGSPGASDPPPPGWVPVLVNEVLSHTDPPLLDAIELYNPNPGPAPIGGWYISDDFRTPKKFRIPAGTTLSAGGYRVFDEGDFNPASPPSPTGFAFNSKGDEAYLFSADAAGHLTGYFHGFAFGAAESGVSLGRHVTSTGEEHFVAQSTPTLGEANAGPKVGPVVLTEIMYHPPDGPDGSDNAEDEFLELQSVVAGDTPLFDPALRANTWRLRGGVDFDFPTNVTLGGGARLLVVNFDPAHATRLAAFRDQFGVPTNVPVFGPFQGKLDNSADIARLEKPDAPEGGEVPWVLVDAVAYSDTAPWPAGADGFGPSLHRRDPAQYGSDPINWVAAAPSPGRAFADGAAPVITAQPTDQTPLATTDTRFSVVASGPAPLRYQWRFNGANLSGATNALLVLTNVQPEQAGVYSVGVFNPTGFAQSSNVALSVLFGPWFLRHPQSTNARAGTTVSFSALALGGAPLTYQWTLNGTSIPDATNATLVLPTVQESHAGVYRALAADPAGAVPSAPATLTLLFDPVIVQPPLSQRMVAGANVTLSVRVTNNATLPIGYRWRRNNATAPGGTFLLHQHTCFFTITNAQPPYTNYTVILTNLARPGGLISSAALLTFLADTDGDGLPDDWESLFGLDAGSALDAELDRDGDGMTNGQEYVAGTDPTDPLSFLKVEIVPEGTGAVVLFGAAAHRTYTLQYTDAPTGAAWSSLAEVLAQDTARTERIPDASFTAPRFYRVVTPRQP